MLKGVSDWAFRNLWTLDKFIDNVANAKYDGIEFNVYAEGDFITLSTSERVLKGWADTAVEAGLRLPSISTPLLIEYALNSVDKRSRQAGIDIVYKMFDIASTLGAEIIQVVPGQTESTTGYEVSYDIAQETILLLADKAKEHGVIMGLENVPSFLPSPLEFARFVAEINHPNVKVYLDIGNTLCCGYPEHWITLLKKQLVALHVKDVRLMGDGKPHVVPLLSGEVNWPAVMSVLHSIQFDSFLIATPTPFQYCQERQLQGVQSDLIVISQL